MGILRVDHPDILEFIDCKKDLSQLTNFNISVAITEEFMQCLEENRYFILRFNGRPYMKVDPKLIWNKLTEGAWKSGEPGIVFIDRINEDNPTPAQGGICATNPCGEIPLLPYEACNLGSINLAHMVEDGKLNEAKLEECVALATDFLDRVIDINKYPLPEIEQMVKANRKIGIGIMGWADMLIQLGVPYESEEAVDWIHEVMEIIRNTAQKTAQQLAEERGSFPNWADSKWSNYPMRNASLLTVAPTGTLSIIADCSSGIEPLFGLSYKKNLADGGTLVFINKYVNKTLTELWDDLPVEEMDEIINKIQKDPTFAPATHELLKVAHQITPTAHIRTQATFQEYVDNSISKTINFNNSTTQEEIGEALRLAYQLGCKGTTVYRDGSRGSQPLEHKDVKEKKQVPAIATKVAPVSALLKPMKRPEELCGITKQVKTGCGKMLVTVNTTEGKPYEVLLKTGSIGGCAGFADGTARLISIALRYGVPAAELVDQLKSVSCDNFRYQAGKDPSLKGRSCPHVIGKVMTEIQEQAKKLNMEEITEQQNSRSEFTTTEIKKLPVMTATCPDCNATLLRTEGCIKCIECGYSKC